jgi:hypothetical protein
VEGGAPLNGQREKVYECRHSRRTAVLGRDW